MQRKRRLIFPLIALFIISSLPITNHVSADGEVDNWPENDAWLRIELVSWSANDSVEWDNNGGLPDPVFKICVEADGENLDCINTPTWDNQLTLNDSWNYSLDVPDHSNILNITIECKDNDAFNDDECDMNSDVNYWRLYAEYNWSATASFTISGNGDDDDDQTWKNAASTWRFSVDGYGDKDGDGITDNIDICSETNTEEDLLVHYIGCSWSQIDIDLDGVISKHDSDPFDSRIREVIGGSRNFVVTNISGGPELERAALTSCSDSMSGKRINLQITNNSQLISGCEWTETQMPEYYNGYDTIFTDIIGDGLNVISSPPADQSHFKYITERFSQDPYCRGGDMQIVSRQLSQLGPALVHCVTQYTDYQCKTILFSLNDSIANSTEIMSFEFDNDDVPSWGQRCNPDSNNYLGDPAHIGHMGAFGDFDGDGVIDFVHDREMDGSCHIYFGLNGEQFEFSNPQIFSNEVHKGCSGAILAADIDNDGFDDIVSTNGIIFMSDDGVEVQTPPFSSGTNTPVHAIHPFDYDSDGDLDIIMKNHDAYTSSRSIYTIYFENPWCLDGDNDGVCDVDDKCPGFNDKIDADSDGIIDGCDDIIDSDNDGTPDEDDDCPNTPVGAIVVSGCPLDDDGDGVYNGLDDCPNTENVNANVDSNGCDPYPDNDKDGVDGSGGYSDNCPYTPLGEVVDVNGCSVTELLDDDGDGMANHRDECPHTPKGANINWLDGCPSDSDNDGIYNGLDQCPDSEYNEQVDDTGCLAETEVSSAESAKETQLWTGLVSAIIFSVIIIIIISRLRRTAKNKISDIQKQLSLDLEYEKKQAQIEVEKLQNQSKQAQIEIDTMRVELSQKVQQENRNLQAQKYREGLVKQASDFKRAQAEKQLLVASRMRQEAESALTQRENEISAIKDKLVEAEKKLNEVNKAPQGSINITIQGDYVSTKNVNESQSTKSSFKKTKDGFEVYGLSEEAAEMALFESLPEDLDLE